MKGNNTEKPLVSVIIPVYGVERYLRQCLDSVVGQTYENLEILVIDDGSIDQSGVIADEYARKDQRVQVIHQENAGLSAARNTGLAKATGEYIICIDSDDFLRTDMLEKLYFAMEETNSDIAVCDYCRLEGERQIPVSILPGGSNLLSGEEAFREIMADRLSSHVWNKLCRAKLYKDVRFPVGQAYEDIAATFRLFLPQICRQVCYVRESLYIYRINLSGISLGGSSRNIYDLYQSFFHRLRYAQQYYPAILPECVAPVALSSLSAYQYGLTHPQEEPFCSHLAQMEQDVRACARLMQGGKGISWAKKIQLRLVSWNAGGYRRFYRLLHKMRNLLK